VTARLLVQLLPGALPGNNPGQVVHTRTPLSPSSIIWYHFNRREIYGSICERTGASLIWLGAIGNGDEHHLPWLQRALLTIGDLTALFFCRQNLEINDHLEDNRENYYPRQGGYVFARVCLSACLSVCVLAR